MFCPQTGTCHIAFHRLPTSFCNARRQAVCDAMLKAAFLSSNFLSPKRLIKRIPLIFFDKYNGDSCILHVESSETLKN